MARRDDEFALPRGVMLDPVTEASLPPKLASLVEHFSSLTDRQERLEALIDIADGFRGVPPEVATRPYPETHRVPQCESEAYVFAAPRSDGSLDLHVAVESPQGISARAMAVILEKGLAGVPAGEIARVPADIAYRIFGNELSMGKGLGLMGMVQLVQAFARRAAAAGEAPGAAAGPRDAGAGTDTAGT
jgi:cysteine desulfuration protein SufE